MGWVTGERGHRPLLGAHVVGGGEGRPSGRRAPAARPAARWSAPRRRRSGGPAWRSVAHSACHAPSARSSTCSAAARCRVAARPGRGERRAADQQRQHRVLLVRHGRRPAAGGPRTARRSRGATRVSTSSRSGPRRRCAATSASPTRVTGRREVCHGEPRVEAERRGELVGESTATCRVAVRRPARARPPRPWCRRLRRPGPGRPARRSVVGRVEDPASASRPP